MKILILIPVLLFSINILAKDDLSGKSIVCGATLKYICDVLGNNGSCAEEPNQEIIIAVEFENDQQAIYHDYKGLFFGSSNMDYPEGLIIPLFYKTNLESIIIYTEEDFLKANKMKYFLKINRETLDFKLGFGNELDLKIGENCLIYDNYEKIDDNILKMKNKIITQITKNNKL